MSRATAPDFAKARAAFHREAATSDRAWDAYRKARARQAKQRGCYAAEQGVIDASAAVARAASRLGEREDDLRTACLVLAKAELLGARPGSPYPGPAEYKARAEAMALCAMRSQ